MSVPRRGSRIDWEACRPIVAELLGQGALAPEIGALLGCSRGAVLSGVARLGLAFDPEAVRARRVKTCREIMNRPDRSARRSRAAKERMGTPEMRQKMTVVMRERVNSPEFRERQARYMAENREEFRRRVSDGAKRRWDKVLGWCPPQFRARYNHLIRSKKMLASEAKAALMPEILVWQRSFEGQLWRLSTGQARLVPNMKLCRPVAGDHSLTGSSLAAL